MTLKDKIKKDFMAAFKAKQTLKKQLLSTIKGEIETQEKSGVEMTDDQVEKILQKFKKNLEQSLSVRDDESTREELNIVSEYLPEELSEEDIREKVSQLISSGVGHIGQIMKEFSNVPCDKKVVSQVARELLQ